MRFALIPILIIGAILASAIAGPIKVPRVLTVSSTAFSDRGEIPAEYTCEGENVSPPIAWSAVPAGTKSIAVLVDDPDAPNGVVTHWLMTSIPWTVRSFGRAAATGYKGPCPPSGRHHYRFTVYALDTTTPKAGTRGEFLANITGHVLASGVLVGLYEKHGTVGEHVRDGAEDVVR